MRCWSKTAVLCVLALQFIWSADGVFADDVLSFKFVMQQNCIAGAGFTDDFDIIGGGGPVPVLVVGTITFDVRSGLAVETDHAMVQSFVPGQPSEPGSPPVPSGQYPVNILVSHCMFDFHLSRDLSFTLAKKGTSCTSTGLNGPNKDVVFTNIGGQLDGQFSPDFGSFVAGTSSDPSKLVESVALPPPGGGFQRICETSMQGARISAVRRY